MSTLLVVDDSAVDRKLVSGLLSRELGWSAVSCENGKEALALLEPPLPDLIVTDLQMPEMNGLELVEMVKDEWPFIPIVLLTAKGSEQIAADALRRGAASYVPKRRLGQDLVDAVRRILSYVDSDRTSLRLNHYLCESTQVFDLRNDLDQLEQLARHIQQQLRCLPLSDETERLRVSLALEEALRNSCLHGNLEMDNPSKMDREQLLQMIKRRSSERPYSQRHLRVTVRIDRDSASFTVQDEGVGFDHQARLKAAVLDDQEHASTRGLALMRTIFDEVSFNSTGNQITLVKHSITADDLLDDDGSQ
ncbi:MAG: response regulator [Planctomycetaceae bacterium]|nr:response regulator [Planctomycetaceae bacterium]